MKILHSSDWHLGRSLYGRQRDPEFAAFLDWLLEALDAQNIDLLLIAGDVFDTTTPSNRAQALYFNFLSKVRQTGCRHVVIIGGNHDSPTFLEAPAAMLRTLDIHVVGAAQGDPATEEVLLLKTESGHPEAILCAVPYLRDRDVRRVEAGESFEDKSAKLIAGLAQHYKEVCAAAEALRQATDPTLPLIALGHLFTAGGTRTDGDGVRDLYIGSLAHMPAHHFPPNIDYLALGHLHQAQKVAGQDHMRYCGSPLPMGFGEAKQQKIVYKIVFEDRNPAIEPLPIPCFQRLAQISGDWSHIAQEITSLKAEAQPIWLEITYNGAELLPDLREKVDTRLADSPLDLLCLRNNRTMGGGYQEDESPAPLPENLSPQDVFEVCLDRHGIPDSQRADLRAAYQEIVVGLAEKDLLS